MSAPATPPHHAAQLFQAQDATVVAGVNLGDGLDDWEEAVAGDVYRLRPGAEALDALLARDAASPATADAAAVMPVAPGSALGGAGDRVALCRRLSLMSSDGDTVQVLGLELWPSGNAPAVPARYLLPLSPMALGAGYTLLRIETNPAPARLPDLLCASLACGTRITLPDGRQQPIETLAPGTRVLTRDHGPQPLRWIGRITLRAQGGFAPVVIAAGVLGNTAELVVSQDHRILLYRRDRHPDQPTSELLVRARHLLDGQRIFLRAGGFVEYFSLVFDRHEIVYAEGIPAESLLVSAATLAQLPEALGAGMPAPLAGLEQRQHFGTELGRDLLDAIGRDRLLGAPPTG